MNGSPEHLAAGFSGAFRPTQSKRLELSLQDRK
jgi:hypothetical protein